MHIDDFEALIRDENNVDYRGIYSRKHGGLQLDQIVEGMLEQNRMDSFNKNIDLSKTPGGFITYRADASQQLMAVDKSVANIFACETVEEFREYVGNSFIGMVHPDDREKIEKEIWRQINSTELKMDYIKYRILRKDGTIGYVNDFGHLEDGEDGCAIFQVFLLDVTGQL